MADTIYKVRDPSGAMREISGPEGASDDEIIAQAQKLFSAPAATPAIATPQPSILSQIGSGAWKGLQYGGPIGAAMGASAPFQEMYNKGAYNLGGGITDLATKVGLPPNIAAGVGTAANVGMQAIPAVAGGFGAAKALAPAMEAGGQRLMQAALKPSKAARDSGDSAKAIKTMLDEGVNVSSGGAEALTARIGKLNDDVAQAIEQSKGMVPVDSMLKNVSDVAQKALYSIRANADMGVIKRAVGDLLEHPLVKGFTEIPVQTAQAIKQGNYKVLGDKAYGFGLKPEAQRDTYKAITSGMRRGIEDVAPQVGPMNKMEGSLINARDLITERLLQAGNRDPLGLGVFAIKDPAMLASWLAQRWPVSQSLLARGMYSGSEAIPALAGGGMQGILSTLQREQP